MLASDIGEFALMDVRRIELAPPAEPQAATGGASLEPLALGQERPGRERRGS